MSATTPDTQIAEPETTPAYDLLTLELNEIAMLAKMIDGMEGAREMDEEAAMLARIILQKVGTAEAQAAAVCRELNERPAIAAVRR